MEIYLVGGALRDELLGRTVHDRDFVVTGATEKEMLSLGYKKVGKNFPVFLHPKTKEEYALARKEINQGQGHKDFHFIFTPDITLEEDSIRRDFTCNAIYRNIKTGQIIDFHNGMMDIENHILRHISPHFKEDPLRVLRMCRFAAQLDFDIAPETMALSQEMVKDGALNHLSADRIWQELEKSMHSKNFYRFIEKARECGALAIILPELEQMFSVPERLDFHPEGNSGAHTLLALKAAQSEDSLVNYAVMLHDIGKTKTDPLCWPSHRDHDKLGVDVIETIGKRLKVPNSYTELATIVSQYHMLYHQEIKNIKREMATTAIYLSRFNHKEYGKRFIEVLRADMAGRAKEVSNDEEKQFNEFSSYLTRLIIAATNKKPSEITEFETIIKGIKEGTIAPIVLNEAYIKELLKENPYKNN